LKKEALQQFPKVGHSIADTMTIEEWQGTPDEHAKYLKANPNWWLHTTFLEKRNDWDRAKPMFTLPNTIVTKIRRNK